MLRDSERLIHSIQLSAFSDQLTAEFDLRDDDSSRALCGHEIGELPDGSIGVMIRGYRLLRTASEAER